jgi:urate oxidase
MGSILTSNNYGKSRVRILKVTRDAQRHDVAEISVDIRLRGTFEKVYTNGDNATVIPTDTMKNTVYALAKKNQFQTIEEFGILLADHFLTGYPQVTGTTISLTETLWNRIYVENNGKVEPHPFSFTHGGNEHPTASIVSTKGHHIVESGIDGLQIMKTTESGFEHYVHDQYTTLKETHDRVLATNMNVKWKFSSSKDDFATARRTIRKAILDSFSHHYSQSVQHSLNVMGNAALDACKEIDEISFSMPNKHYLLFNLEQFGLENKNEIFVPTDEPYGLIEGTLKRK